MPGHRSKAVPVDLGAVRTKLQQSGPQVWRSLDEMSETSEFKEYLHREFPSRASEWLDPVGRRSFLKLMSASMALAGVTACTVQPKELIVPYVRQPEEEIPGKPLYFATAMTHGGVATGLLVESHEGRPTKVEGNPDHPASRGATDLFAQGSVLTLYDPDRSQTLLQYGNVRPWNAAIAAIRGGLSAQAESKGAGLRILTETIASPTLAAQIQQVLALQPGAKWIQWEAVNRDNARAGSRAAFGQYVEPLYDLTKADVILSLDADFLSSDGAHNLYYMRQFASRRRVEESADNLNRLYVVESNMTPTGGRADNRLPLKSSQVEAFARAVAAGTGASGVSGTAPSGSEAFASAVAKDLSEHKGRAVVIAGDAQPPAVHAIAHAINAAIGAPVTYLPTPEIVPTDQNAAMRELVADINAGQVQMLVIIGESNPVFTAPADLKFDEAIQKVSLVVHSGLFFDETARLSQWHVPAAHYLEAWSDARTIDGTVSIVQPLIQPLYGGKSAHEIIATMSPTPERQGYDIVREYWLGNAPKVMSASAATAPSGRSGATGSQAAQAASSKPAPPAAPKPGGEGSTGEGGFEKTWRKWLHDGIIEGSAAIAGTSTVAPDVATRVAQTATPVEGVEINFRRDPTIYDGRYSNNGWLQELPKPMSKLTWDTAAHISPAMAAQHSLGYGDVIAISHEGRSLNAPVFIMPGHANDSITITVGYGRRQAGRIGNGTGVNAYALRGSSAPFFGPATMTVTGDHYDLAVTQEHWAIDGRNLIRSATLEQFKENPAFVKEMEEVKEGKRISLYPDKEYRGQQWGMAIDMNACTGCMACVIACVAENNIPVVGKTQVKTNREMHWLRIDRYFAGNPDSPDVYLQPMTCQQCENAPCEVVCPVEATTHSAEGLNDMVYNRCVGTRYCSNNCPWKVRRFNFLLYQDWNTPTFKLQRNPDVTVRSRGVMEKCTYCVQRINAARIQAKREERDIRDGEIVTACQAVCPTDAIIFGNINDPNSRVAKLKTSPRNYTMLEELNTRPRTTYLAAVKNQNPDQGLHNNPMVGHHETTTHEASEGGAR
ncbi:MAG TPA: TAT-variant-translocated molybdopterin oxidoreductase [Vicinamibacterales bacterium]|nr:TAT-variant-translocated molybdopterin oxidoreductase [Vicinamibacterales bacterium]